MTLLCLAVGPAQAARRGPYLQNLQVDRITICWETPQAQKGEVRLADADGRPIKQVAAPESSTRHEVIVDGLQPGRQYTYEVVAGDKAGSFGKGSFRSMPAPGEPITFVAWGDSREGKRVSAALSALMLKAGVGMVLHTGDLVSDGKQMHQWDSDLFGPCAELMRNTVLWPVIGNHDTGMMPDKSRSVFEHVFALPGKEAYYSFDYGDAHFLVLDTTSRMEEQARFAEEDLARTKARWRFAAWHNPPFSSSHHPSHVPSRKLILPILARHNVDMIIAGHNHNYMVSKPIRHVYEPRQERPYVQLVTGGGGAYPADFDSTDRWFEHARTAYHFVLITIDGDKLQAKAIDPAGRVFHRFELTKSAREAVPFELIEFERYLTELTIRNTNLAGWPTGLLLGPQERSGTFVYQFANPLQEPLKLKVDFDVSAGLQFEPASHQIEVSAGGQAKLEAPFRVVSPERLYPARGPAVSFECGLGKGQVRMSEPPVALGREVVARRTEETVTLDGQAKEPAWSNAPEQSQFARWAPNGLSYQAPAQATTARLMHDRENLYLLLRRPIAPPADGKPPQLSADEILAVYLAGPSKALGIRARATGKHEFEGTRGLDEGVVATYGRQDDHIAWEVKIPLAKLRENLPAGQPLVFNVMDTRGKDVHTLAPTFRQHFSRTNSAALVLE